MQTHKAATTLDFAAFAQTLKKRNADKVEKQAAKRAKKDAEYTGPRFINLKGTIVGSRNFSSNQLFNVVVSNKGFDELTQRNAYNAFYDENTDCVRFKIGMESDAFDYEIRAGDLVTFSMYHGGNNSEESKLKMGDQVIIGRVSITRNKQDPSKCYNNCKYVELDKNAEPKAFVIPKAMATMTENVMRRQTIQFCPTTFSEDNGLGYNYANLECELAVTSSQEAKLFARLKFDINVDGEVKQARTNLFQEKIFSICGSKNPMTIESMLPTLLQETNIRLDGKLSEKYEGSMDTTWVSVGNGTGFADFVQEFGTQMDFADVKAHFGGETLESLLHDGTHPLNDSEKSKVKNLSEFTGNLADFQDAKFYSLCNQVIFAV